MPTQSGVLVRPPEPFVETLDRLLCHILAESWAAFSVAWCAPGRPPRFSGVHPLGSRALLPYLEAPGILLIFGPRPGLPLLEMVEAIEPTGIALWARVREGQDLAYSWRPAGGCSLPPRFAACISLGGQWAFSPFLKTHLLRLLQPWGQPLGELLECPPPQ